MKEILVAKYGSSTLTGDNGIEQGLIDGYAAELARQHDAYDLVVVTSGAVAAGRTYWHTHHGAERHETPSIQSLAGIGSPRIFAAWQDAFDRAGLLAAVIPITHREIDDTQEGPALQRSLYDNRASGIVTVINENDAVSDEELARLSYGGENDGLASHVARSIGANTLILFTKKGGIVDDEGMELRVVEAADYNTILDLARTRTVGHGGRGGLLTKVNAAFKAAGEGVNVYIAASSSPIEAILNGETGTFIPGSSKPPESTTIAGI